MLTVSSHRFPFNCPPFPPFPKASGRFSKGEWHKVQLAKFLTSRGAHPGMEPGEQLRLREAYVRWSGGRHIGTEKNLRPLVTDFFKCVGSGCEGNVLF